MIILKQSHSDEKLRRGDPWGFLKLELAEKYQKLEGGRFEDKKRKKSHTEAKQTQRHDTNTTVSSDFVSYVKNVVNKRGDPLD